MSLRIKNKIVASLLLIATIVASLPLHMVAVLANAVIPVPSHIYTGEFLFHNEWDGGFNHGISIRNISDSYAIGNFRIYFEIENGIVDDIGHHGILESGSGTVVINYNPSGQTVIFPGQNHQVTIMGVLYGGNINVSNIRLYGNVMPHGGGNQGGDQGNNQGGGNQQPQQPPAGGGYTPVIVPENPYELPVSVQFRNPNTGNVLSQLDPWFRITAHQEETPD